MSLRKADRDGDLPLELFLCNNQFRLATPAALYSDGLSYPPARKFLKEVAGSLKDVKSVLLLGSGIGSTIGMLNQIGCYPQFTIIDINETILSWAVDINLPRNPSSLHPLCVDAASYMEGNKDNYDLIFVDVFIGREVPDFVMQHDFLANCRRALNPGGVLGLNYIVNDDEQWYHDEKAFRERFQNVVLLSFDMNRVLVART